MEKMEEKHTFWEKIQGTVSVHEMLISDPI